MPDLSPSSRNTSKLEPNDPHDGRRSRHEPAPTMDSLHPPTVDGGLFHAGSIFERLTPGLTEWPAIGLLFLGILLGVWLGAVPGLGGILGLIILLPFTYGMDPVSAFALLLGMYAVTVTGDTISAVMIGVPGTASGAATVLDGYALAKKGPGRTRPQRAAYTSSAVGGVFGALVLGLSLPLIRPIIFAFGSPEVFMLGLLGLAMVSTLSGTSPLKGLTVAVLGLGLTTIGYGEVRAVPRYWFGLDYLLDGLPIFPVVFGLFAVPEVMELAIRNVSISRVTKDKVVAGGIIDGIRDVGRHWWLVLRGSIIGAYIGFLPGVGGPVADWVASGHAGAERQGQVPFRQGRHPQSDFGPEASNNAHRGGELIPMFPSAYPGGFGSAILMSALIIQGLKPGPDMLTLNAHITFSLVWTLVIANVVCAVLADVLEQSGGQAGFRSRPYRLSRASWSLFFWARG